MVPSVYLNSSRNLGIQRAQRSVVCLGVLNTSRNFHVNTVPQNLANASQLHLFAGLGVIAGC